MYMVVSLNLCVSALLCEVFSPTLLCRATATLDHIKASICSDGNVAIQSNAMQCVAEADRLSLLVARVAQGHVVSPFWHHPQLTDVQIHEPHCIQL